MKTAVALLVVVGGCKAADDYVKKSKTSEAQLNLNRLAKSAKVQWTTNGQFPVGNAGPTPPQSCCLQSDKCERGKMKPDPAQWTGIWQQLDFTIDEPHFYRYSYESDGKSVNLSAIGDLDCDLNEVTWKATITIDGDAPKSAIVEPPPGEY